MEKVHCNIIRDLLPSYADEIASEESKQMIEEHFKECEECKKVYASLKEHDFVAEKANAGIEGYLKKIGLKKRMEHRGMLALTFFLFLLQFFLNFTSYVMLPSLYIANCIFYPMYVILLLNVLGTWKKHSFYTKAERGILAIEGISLFYIIGIFYVLFINLASSKTQPFGLADYQIGPFLDCQLKVLMAVYFMIFLTYLILQGKEKIFNQNIILILLAGAAVLLNIRASLYQMESILPMVKTVSIFLAVVVAENILLYGFCKIHTKFPKTVAKKC